MCPDDTTQPSAPADNDELLDDFHYTTRRGDFETWIPYFAAHFRNVIAPKEDLDPELKWRANAAALLNATYWDTVRSDIRPQMRRKENGRQGRIDHHKICSVMEINIMCLLPIEHDDDLDRKYLNALFAWFVANTILESWIPPLKDFPTPDDFIREHMCWLVHLRAREGNPYFSNSATWYFYELFARERLGIGNEGFF